MNSRERFRETMEYGKPDRVPYFEEGIRDDVLSLWRRQGLAPDGRWRGPETQVEHDASGAWFRICRGRDRACPQRFAFPRGSGSA